MPKHTPKRKKPTRDEIIITIINFTIFGLLGIAGYLQIIAHS